MRAGKLFALAAVEIDGVQIEIHGIRAMRVPPASCRKRCRSLSAMPRSTSCGGHDPPDGERYGELRAGESGHQRPGHATHAERRFDDPAEGGHAHRQHLFQLGAKSICILYTTTLPTETSDTGVKLAVGSE